MSLKTQASHQKRIIRFPSARCWRNVKRQQSLVIFILCSITENLCKEVSWLSKPCSFRKASFSKSASSPGVSFEISGPLARLNDISLLNGCACKHNRLTPEPIRFVRLSVRRVTGSPWIADFRSWTWPEVAIPVANQKDRGLWEGDLQIFPVWRAFSRSSFSVTD